MKDLYDKGYGCDQISQILKIEETGFNIVKHITPSVPTDALRMLRDFLKNESYSMQDKIVITKFLVEDGIDVRPYVERGINITAKIRIMEEAKAEGFDTNLFHKSFNVPQSKTLLKYLKQGHDISKLLLDGKSENYIEAMVKVGKIGVTYDALKDFKNDTQKDAILKAALDNINVLPHIKPNSTPSQIKSIAFAIKNNIDLSIVTKENYAGSVMDVIIVGLLNGYDITPHITEETKRQSAELILKCLKEGVEFDDVKKYSDHKVARLAMRLKKRNLPTAFLDDERYCYEQLSIIATAYESSVINPSVDVSKMLDPDYPEMHMRIIYGLMLHGKKLDDVLIKGVSIPSLSTIQKFNLKDIYFDGLIYPGMDTAEITAIGKLKMMGYKVSK